MSIGDRVKERREALGMTQPELSQAVRSRGGSLSQGQISGLEAGTVQRPRSLPELAEALQTTVAWLLGREESAGPAQTPDHKMDISPARMTGRVVAAADPLIVWRSVPNPARAGETLIYKEQAGLTSRPVELAFSKDAFAVEVVDDEAEPRYERRAKLLLDPSTTPAEGDDCWFVRNPDANPTAGMARRLVRITPEHWVVKRFQKDAPVQRLDRNEFRAAWYIFGSYNRR